MRIIKSSIILLAAISFVSCGEKSEENNTKPSKVENTTETINTLATETLTINGSMQNGAGSMIKMYLYSGNQPMAIDSAQVDDNDQFIFNKSQNGYEFIGIGDSPMNAALLIANGGEAITISGTKENWVQDFSIEGSEHSKIMKEYFGKRQAYSTGIQELKMQMQAIGKTDQSALDKINEEGMAMQVTFEEYKYNFIKKNINSPAVYAAFQDIYDLSKDENILKDMSATMSKFMPNTVFAQAVEQKYLQAKQQNAQPAPAPAGALSVGSVAPELNFPGLDGKNVSLNSLKGNVVLLDFWASWCGPCRKENPNVVKLYNQYKDKGFTVYSYSLDQDKNKWANAIQKDGLIWPNHVSDLKGWNAAGGAIYGVNSIPQTYLIGADGKIIAVGLRGVELENKLKEILG